MSSEEWFTLLSSVGFIIFIIRKTKNRTKSKHKKQFKPKKWYPTGWVFNEDTKMWEPPDYPSK